MDLRVDDSAMKSLVAKAIVDSLSPEAREKLISDAVTKSLTVPAEGGGYYGNKRSPLQQAFDLAVEQEARKYAEQVLTEDGKFKEQLQSLFTDVAAKLFSPESRPEIIDGVAETIRRALTKDRY